MFENFHFGEMATLCECPMFHSGKQDDSELSLKIILKTCKRGAFCFPVYGHYNACIIFIIRTLAPVNVPLI